MRDRPLLFRVDGFPSQSASWREQIQMVLAMAEAPLLRSLLTDCQPPLIEASRIASIAVEVAVPTGEQQISDGVLTYQAISAIPADSVAMTDLPTRLRDLQNSRELAKLVQHESEMQTLGQKLPLAPTVALLAQAGMSPNQIQEILRLSQDSWHKSWWYRVDAQGEFSIPFLRCIRTRHYPDGCVTILYKDYFDQEKPPCFACQPERVLIASKSKADCFSQTLGQINQQRRVLNIDQVVLLVDQISALEAQAFIRQGIRLYSLIKLLLPVVADCAQCDRHECPLHGQENSPVASCYGFLPMSELL
jgi:hypothetical protein